MGGVTRPTADVLIRKLAGREIWFASSTLPDSQDLFKNVLAVRVHGEPAVLAVVADGREHEAALHLEKEHPKRRFRGVI